MPDDRLTLLGQSVDDLPALSALLQDATLRTQDLAFDARARRLVLLVNRYRWESPNSRVRAALRLETITAVQHQNWHDDAVLNLLSLAQDGDWLVLVFAGGAALRARAEVIDIILEDIAPPWPTGRVPQHPA